MKESIRRLLSIVAVLALILSTVTVLSGCYITRSAKMKYVEGTYELTAYSGNGDWLTEREIKLIMVIRADGTGYYGYKDFDTEPFISELRCRFVSDPEKSGKYQFVEIDFRGDGQYHKLGINADWNNQTLNSQTPVWKPLQWGELPEIDYHVNVGFRRVDRAKDISYIVENFGDVPHLPFGAKKYSGTYKLEGIVANDKSPDMAVVPENPFVYYYITFDFIKGTAVLRAMKKSDESEITNTVEGVEISLVDGQYIITSEGKIDMKINPMYAYPSHRLDVEDELPEGWYTLQFVYCGEMTEEQIIDSIDDDVNRYLASKDFSEE